MEAKETNITPQAELPILEVEHLRVQFTSDSGTTTAVVDESFSIRPGETLALVGESGSGKSVTSLSVMRLVEHGGGKIVNGSIKLRCRDGRVVDLRHANKSELQHLRGSEVAMIFQEPMTSLNPVFTVGAQIAESLILHRGMDEKEALKEAVHLLELVRIPDAERISLRFPHQLSGGMRQRVMIAMALACDPDILIADEPTTALDVTIQAQIIELMQEMQEKNGNAIIMITHDLGVVADMADKIMVMYAGRPVEFGTAEEIFYESRHPYTWGLIRSIPEQAIDEKKPLTPIHGNPPSLMNLPEGCVFSPRCPYATDKCRKQRPERFVTESGHYSACHYAGDPEFLKNAPVTSRTRKDSKKGGEA